jgi:hypothetical protein
MQRLVGSAPDRPPGSHRPIVPNESRTSSRRLFPVSASKRASPRATPPLVAAVRLISSRMCPLFIAPCPSEPNDVGDRPVGLRAIISRTTMGSGRGSQFKVARKSPFSCLGLPSKARCRHRRPRRQFVRAQVEPHEGFRLPLAQQDRKYRRAIPTFCDVSGNSGGRS